MRILNELFNAPIRGWFNKGFKLQASGFRLILNSEKLVACSLQPAAVLTKKLVIVGNKHLVES